MKTNVILITLLTLITQGVSPLFINEVNERKISYSYGPFKANLVLKSINMFENAKTWKSSCESSDMLDLSPTQGCDLVLHSIFCFANIYSIPYKNYYLFTVDTNEKVQDTSSKHANIFSCTKVNRYFVGYDKNYKTYQWPLAILATKNGSFNYLGGHFFQVQVGDVNFLGYPYYKFFNVQGIRYGSLINYVTYPFEGYINMFKSTWKIVIGRYGGCLTNYFGDNCWFYCKDDNRRKCNCNAKVYTYSCQPECHAGWVTTYDRYSVPNHNVKIYIKVCNILELCNDAAQCPGSTCFQLNNSSYKCYKIFPLIKRDNQGPNLTSDVVLVGETYSINLSMSLIPNPVLHKNHVISLVRKSPVFIQHVFRYLDGFQIPYIKIIGETVIDRFLELPIFFYYQPFMRNIENVKKFRIYAPPSNLELRDMKSEKLLGKYIYKGQKISCNSTGKPDYRIIIFWWTTLDFRYRFGAVQQIPTDSMLGIAEITCKVLLVAKGRKPITKIRKFIKYIKAQGSLYWNTSDNIIMEGQYIACISVAFVKYIMRIFQIVGFGQIDPIKHVVPLKGLIGGYYKLCCTWSHGKSHIIRTLTFYLRTQATLICFMLHPNVIGTLIQCTHNGFLNDDYITRVTASFLTELEVIKMSRESFIRLPYEINSNSITLTCAIESKIPQFKSQNVTKTVSLSTLSKEIYTLTDSFRECPKYGNYIEFPDIITYGMSSVEIVHLVFYYRETDPSTFQIFVFFLIYTVLMGFCGATVVFFNLVTEDNGLYHNVNIVLRVSRMRRINDKFEMTAKTYLSIQLPALSVLQLKLSSAEDSS